MAQLADWRKRTLYVQFREIAEQFPTNEFMVLGDSRALYDDALTQVDRLARSLISLGVKRGDNVALWMGNCPEWAYVWLACASIGACLVPVNTRYRAHEVEYILKQSDSVALIMKNRFLNIEYMPILREVAPELSDASATSLRLGKLPELRHIVVLGPETCPGILSYSDLMRLGESTSAEAYHRAQAIVSPDDRAIMVYTSGTTGFPKGAVHNHNLLRNMARVSELMGYTDRDRILVGALPFFHVFGSFAGVTCALLTGATLVLMESYEPGQWLALWEKEKCTSIYGVPTVFILALDHPDVEKHDLSSGRTGIIGGALCPVEVVRAIHSKMGLRVLTGYGMTEATAVTTLSKPEDDPETVSTTVGRPIGGFEVKVADPATGKELPSGVQGEIWTRGHHVMMGYYKKPNETAQAIDASGWLHTGDLAVSDERGYFRISGRLKDMFITGGFNVYPAEIEDFLFQHPSVKQVCVVGIPDYKMGEVGVAFVELKEGVSASAEEIVQFCARKLANFKVPRHVRFVAEWPMTASGKVQKFELRAQAIEELKLQSVAQGRLLQG